MADTFVYACGIQRAYLRVVDRTVPPARKERRVGAEQQAVRPGNLERLSEDAGQREPVVIRHPPVRARRVEVDVWGEVGDEQRFAEKPGAEVRNDERHARDGRRRAREDRADCRGGRRNGSAVRASSARRPTARRSARRQPCRGASRRAATIVPHARIVQRIALHRRKQADRSAGRVRRARARSRAAASAAVGSSMKKPTMRDGCWATARATDSSSPGTLAISAARATPARSSSCTQRSARSLRRAWLIPSKRRDDVSGRLLRSRRRRWRPSVAKNCSEKKWTVAVVRHSRYGRV